ncbi:hypothetical protein PHYBOEH_005517 [Phytophthora boehmeriae]|uniref:Glycosyl hydrolase n=1 Tax=Phytophthora boehmeriae TaxID=109152 RepID=A0A8T1X9R2_9STRA|nr:hypothetical protein PHYBOEH_005517 [Phytophthora boehmeriae]
MRAITDWLTTGCPEETTKVIEVTEVTETMRRLFRGVTALLPLLLLLCLTDLSWRSVGASSSSAPSASRCFPDDFLFGTTTAAVHSGVEGADVADAFYYRYHEDFKRMKTMGLSSFRLSISWSKIMHWGADIKRMQPTPEGIAFYHALLDNLKTNGIHAVVTLYHTDLPAALQSQLEPTAGWLDPDIVTHFEEFAELAFREFGWKVKYWATFNEPLTLISGGCGSCNATPRGMNLSDSNLYTVAHHVLLSHARAVQTYRRLQKNTGLVDKQARIGIALNVAFGYPVNETNALDVAVAECKMQFDVGWFVIPLVSGDYPETMRGRASGRLPQLTTDQVDLVKGSYDVFIMNHHSSRMVTDCDVRPLNHTRDEVVGDKRARSDSYLATIKWLHSKDPTAPILLTDNGWCGDERVENMDQSWYFQSYIEQLYKAVVEDNMPIIGYTAWSFLGNNEWSSSLHYTNFTTKEISRSSAVTDLTRIPRPARWCLDSWDVKGVEQSTVQETGEMATLHEKKNPEAGGNGVDVPWSLGEVLFLVAVGLVILGVITCQALRELRQSSRGSPEELEVLITIE